MTRLTQKEAERILEAVAIAVGSFGEPPGELRTELISAIRKVAAMAEIDLGRTPLKTLRGVFGKSVSE